MAELLKLDIAGKICVAGCSYDDTPEALTSAAKQWRDCAWSVVKSAQEDTDWAYRKMGAVAASIRLNVSRQLLARAAWLADRLLCSTAMQAGH